MSEAIVDVDSHFQEPVTWLSDFDAVLAASLPGTGLLEGMAAFAGQSCGELPSTPFWDALRSWAVTSTLADTRQLTEDPATRALFGAAPFDPTERVRWLDASGIDHQICHPTIGSILWSGSNADNGNRRAVAGAYNRWAVAASAGTGGRLHPSVLVDLHDLSWSCDELKWAADHGCRTVLLPIDLDVWAWLATREADRFWDVAGTTGLAAVLHIGVVDRKDARTTVLAHWADVPLQAQRCLARWATSAVASRRDARILVEELGVDWALPWRRNLLRASETGVVRALGGEVEAPVREALDRIMWSVLPRDAIAEVIASGDQVMLAFGSDYPHREGWIDDDPVGSFRARVGGYEHVATWPGLDYVEAAHAANATRSHSSG